MANNRMWICCAVCLGAEGPTFEESSVYVAKYYPSTGWGRNSGAEAAEAGRRMESFFDAHSHGTPHGDYLRIVYESGMPIGGTKKAVLEAICRP